MISQELLEKLQHRFIEYSSAYTHSDEKIKQHYEVKRKHTFRVCENMIILTESLGYKYEDILIAELIALYHDIGRFEQFVRYGTFRDSESVNHAELGVEVIKENKFFEELDLDTKNLIFQSILNHNKPSLKGIEDGRLLNFSKLIRDADKLDIYKVIIDYENDQPSELDQNYQVSDEILSAFNRRSVVGYDHIYNKSDDWLMRVSWIFDINYQPTFQLLDHFQYLPFFLDRLPKSHRLNCIRGAVKEHMKKHVFHMVNS